MNTTQTSTQPVRNIPDKLFYKIGEVCEIVGVQAHVLRYWETEFPMLAPQKNRAGQRTYRRKDVEMALHIRDLLYEEGFTISGARKKLQGESRSGARLKVVTPGDSVSAPPMLTVQPAAGQSAATSASADPAGKPVSRDTIIRLKLMLKEMLTLLNDDARDMHF
jgi:DNA-binding transcriptional MerR regulator